MGREVEIKMPLCNSTEVKHFLENNAKLKLNEHQLDVYFDSENAGFTRDISHISKWLRVRIEGEKATINYKKWLPEDAVIKTHCDEYEVVISSSDEMTQLLNGLGFFEVIRVDKIRNSWQLEQYEISIDSVEGLGDFIEVEYKGTTDDVSAIREKLFKIVEEIGAVTSDIDLKGYPYLLLEKKLSN